MLFQRQDSCKFEARVSWGGCSCRDANLPSKGGMDKRRNVTDTTCPTTVNIQPQSPWSKVTDEAIFLFLAWQITQHVLVAMAAPEDRVTCGLAGAWLPSPLHYLQPSERSLDCCARISLSDWHIPAGIWKPHSCPWVVQPSFVS